MHDDADLTSDYHDYEAAKADEGGLHTGREAPHPSRTTRLMLLAVIGLLLAFYLISLLVP